MKRGLFLAMAVGVVLMGCSTFVSIRTTPNDAKIKINGQVVGNGQVDAVYSNFDFAEYSVEISKPGYQTLHATLQKEFKVGAFILGLFIWPELLFVYGPNSSQIFELERDTVGI
jgi:hypothetical protein